MTTNNVQNDIEKINADYTEEYCAFLEAAYGNNMLSEGGTEAFENLFAQDNPSNKKILDIGFGLGALAFYLAEKYQSQVTGLEINPWMVEETIRRTPDDLKNQVEFLCYNPDQPLPFADASFDIVVSKGVLTHLQNKSFLFKEIYRILKPEGRLLIDDWLSLHNNQWGESIQKMCELEDLTLYALNEASYLELLANSGFKKIESANQSNLYLQYNCDIVENLKKHDKNSTAFQLNGFSLDDAIQSYTLIAQGIEQKELIVQHFRCTK